MVTFNIIMAVTNFVLTSPEDFVQIRRICHKTVKNDASEWKTLCRCNF